METRTSITFIKYTRANIYKLKEFNLLNKNFLAFQQYFFRKIRIISYASAIFVIYYKCIYLYSVKCKLLKYYNGLNGKYFIIKYP